MAPKKPGSKGKDARSPSPADGPRENVKAYFDIAADKVELGRIEFDLLMDTCPKTAENFKVCLAFIFPSTCGHDAPGTKKVPYTMRN